MFQNIQSKIKSWVEKVKKIPPKFYLITFCIQFFIAILILLVFGIVPVLREVERFKENQNHERCSSDYQSSSLIHNYLQLRHYEAVLSNKLKMAKDDSIALIIDLQDSLVKLTFKGIDLFTSKITGIKKNAGLRKLPFYLLDSLFSGPFLIEYEYSSIEKFPIVVKKAPKDTIEAEQTSRAPQLPKQSDVFYSFVVNERCLIEIVQSEEDLIGVRSDAKKYRKQKERFLKTKNLKSVYTSNSSPYIYQLTVKIPREDARSIYRALPVKPAVLIRY